MTVHPALTVHTIHVHTHTHTRTHARTHTRTHTHKLTHTYTHTHTHTRTHERTHARTHTHTLFHNYCILVQLMCRHGFDTSLQSSDYVRLKRRQLYVRVRLSHSLSVQPSESVLRCVQLQINQPIHATYGSRKVALLLPIL